MKGILRLRMKRNVRTSIRQSQEKYWSVRSPRTESKKNIELIDYQIPLNVLLDV